MNAALNSVSPTPPRKVYGKGSVSRCLFAFVIAISKASKGQQVLRCPLATSPEQHGLEMIGTQYWAD